MKLDFRQGFLFRPSKKKLSFEKRLGKFSRNAIYDYNKRNILRRVSFTNENRDPIIILDYFSLPLSVYTIKYICDALRSDVKKVRYFPT